MSEITVITNNAHRDVIYGYELTAEEREQFDYIAWDEPDNDSDVHNFFRYKGELYDLEEFQPTTQLHSPETKELREWSGYMSDTFFSGMVIRYVENFERVVVGRYYS